MTKIRVAIVEDDPEWLKIMQTILGRTDDILIVGLASTKEEGLKLVEANGIDIFLVDINLTENNLDGIYLAFELREKGFGGKIVMLTSLNDDEIIQKSFTAGAVNYILKKNVSEIPSLIRKAYVEKSPVEVMAEDYCRLKQEELLRVLTPAEREVFELAQKGLTRSEMEKVLIKSENTLKGHFKRILRKLKASSTKEAVKKVKSGGIM